MNHVQMCMTSRRCLSFRVNVYVECGPDINYRNVVNILRTPSDQERLSVSYSKSSDSLFRWKGVSYMDLFVLHS
jgi:hypothetical protein